MGDLNEQPWLKNAKNGSSLLLIFVQPGSRTTELVGIHDNQLKMKVMSPPEDGAANKELIEFLSNLLGIGRKSIELRSGGAARRKVVEIHGVAPLEISARIISNLAKRDAKKSPSLKKS